MRIVIVGAGIAGMSLAHELQRQGIEDVVVLERAHAFAHVGAGIHLGPWGMAVLDANGVGESVRRRGLSYPSRAYYDRRGQFLGRIDFEGLARQHGGPTGAFIRRAALHECLAEAVPQAELLTGVDITSVADSGGGVRVETSTHGTFDADLLVGCDGLHSLVRTHLLGVKEQPLGKRSLRGIVDAPDDLAEVEIYRGAGSTIGLARIDGIGHAYAWTHVPAGMPGIDPLPEDPAAVLADLLSGYAAPRMRELAERLTRATVVAADLFEVTVPTWWRGRVVLAGDAAHAMSPSAGSGGAMAFEDAAVLARKLASAMAGACSIEEALDRYTRARLPRVEGIRAQARYTDYDGQISSPDLCDTRDARFARLLDRPDAFAAEVTGVLDLDR